MIGYVMILICSCMIAFFVGFYIYCNWQSIRQSLLYMQWVKIPLRFRPLHYDSDLHFAVKIPTEDGETIGAWIYHYRGHKVLDQYKTLQKEIDKEHEPIVIPNGLPKTVVCFFHGRGVTRARSKLQKEFKIISQTLDATILVIDYRGFGDSTGEPNFEGLVYDGKAAWNYALNCMNAQNIIFWGQSIGSGLAAYLSTMEVIVFPKDRREVKYALVLEAPYTHIREALLSHWIFTPFKLLSKVKQSALSEFLIIDEWNNKKSLENVTWPVFIMHAKNDRVIPQSHGLELYNAHKNFSRTAFYFPDSGGHGGLAFTPRFSDELWNFAYTCSFFQIEGVL